MLAELVVTHGTDAVAALRTLVVVQRPEVVQVGARRIAELVRWAERVGGVHREVVAGEVREQAARRSRRSAAPEGFDGIRVQRTGRVVTVALQHLFRVIHGCVGGDVATAVATVDADHQRQLLAFAVGHRVVRQGVLRRIAFRETRNGVAQLGAARAAEVVLVPVEAVLGRDLNALEVLLHDEVDDAGDRVRAVHGRCAAGEDVDPLDHLRRDLVDVRCRGRRRDAAIRHAPAVDQDQRPRGPEAAQVQRRRAGRAVGDRHVLRSEGLRQLVHEVLDTGDALRHDIRRGDLRHRRRRFEVCQPDARSGDDDLIHAFLRVRRCRNAGGRHRAHHERATHCGCDMLLAYHDCVLPRTADPFARDRTLTTPALDRVRRRKAATQSDGGIASAASRAAWG